MGYEKHRACLRWHLDLIITHVFVVNMLFWAGLALLTTLPICLGKQDALATELESPAEVLTKVPECAVSFECWLNSMGVETRRVS